jgi:glycosyltransferase involved in cell wall biosynthesis
MVPKSSDTISGAHRDAGQPNGKSEAADPSAFVTEARAGVAHGCVVGIVSVAPTTEMSGQGRVLAQLVDGAGMSRAVIFSEARVESNGPDGAAVRLGPSGLSIDASIQMRAAEIALGARQTGCTVLVGCSGSPYDLTATALAARGLNLPFLAYLFDDPVFQWPARRLRAAAVRMSKIWLPQAKTVIVPNEFLAEDWRKRGAVRVAVVRNPVADIVGPPEVRAVSLLPGSGLPIVYMGSVYHAQADAFRNLVSAMNAMGGEFHLHVFTSQAPSIVTGCGLGGAHLTRHDHVAAAEVSAVLAAASLLFLPLGFDTGIPEVIRTASPAKLGDYLRSGRPILAHVPADSFVAHFCRQYDCAAVVDKPDVEALANAARRLARGGPDVARLVANARAVSEQFRASKARQEFWSNVDRAIAGGLPPAPERVSVAEGEAASERASDACAADDVARDSSGLPTGPILLFLGPLAPLKGPDLLVEAFAQVSEPFRDVCLLLVGPDRGMRASLVDRARSLGIAERVHFRVSLDEPGRCEVYLRAVALVVPSRSDMMPFEALEAGAAGVPVLTTEACNFNELAQVGGGLVVASNSAALAEGLSRMLGDRAALQRMGERLSAFVRERYRWLDGDSETLVGLPVGLASPHLPLLMVEQPHAAPLDLTRSAGAAMSPPATVVKEPLKRRVRLQVKRLAMRVPAVERYISEKHVIASERDQAVKDREQYESLLRDLRDERNQILKDQQDKLQVLLRSERAALVSERKTLEKEIDERRHRESVLRRERTRHLEQIWGRPRIEALNRVLFVSDIPPCTNYSGGILIKEMMESIDCLVGNAFILLNRELSPKVPLVMQERLSMRVEAKPLERYVVGAECNEDWIREKETQNLAEIERDTLPRLLKFAESSGCSAFWVLLEGQSMIRLAHALLGATQHAVHVQVTDPPKWWLREHSVDPESTREILGKFDGVLRRARSLAAASWSMMDAYQGRYGVTAVPVVGSLPASMARPPAQCANASTLKIGFAGQIYAPEEWESLQDAIDALQWQVNGVEIEIHVHASQIPKVRRDFADRIQVHGWLDTEPLIEKLSTYDILYCPYWFDEIHREDAELCFPSKIATYLAAGRPILFHGPAYSSPSRFLEKWEAAFICNDPHPSALAATLRCVFSDHALYARISRQGRHAFDHNLTQEHMAASVCRFLQV